MDKCYNEIAGMLRKGMMPYLMYGDPFENIILYVNGCNYDGISAIVNMASLNNDFNANFIASNTTDLLVYDSRI